MSALILPPRQIWQPQYPARPNWASGIIERDTTVEILLPSVAPGYGAVGRRLYPLGSTPPVRQAGGGGVGALFTGGSATSYVELAPNVDEFLSTSKCTYLILRELTGLSFSGNAQHGYVDNGTTNRVSVHLPYTNNEILWDCGGYTATHRLTSGALTWAVGTIDAIALVAGPTKGREIWRNNVRIAANSSIVGTRSASSTAFRIGASGGIFAGANPEIIYQFVVINDELSDERLKRWFANPWAILAAPTEWLLWSAAPLPAVSAALAGVEGGADTAAAAAAAGAAAALAAAETAPDIAAGLAAVAATAAADAAEAQADAAAAAAAAQASASFAAEDAPDSAAAEAAAAIAAVSVMATETGRDGFVGAAQIIVPGLLAAAEEGADTAAGAAGAHLLAGIVAAEDAGDTMYAVARVLGAAGGASADEIWGYLLPTGRTAAETLADALAAATEARAMVQDLYRIHGLHMGVPLEAATDLSWRRAGSILQTITESGGVTTMERQS